MTRFTDMIPNGMLPLINTESSLCQTMDLLKVKSDFENIVTCFRCTCQSAGSPVQHFASDRSVADPEFASP